MGGRLFEPEDAEVGDGAGFQVVGAEEAAQRIAGLAGGGWQKEAGEAELAGFEAEEIEGGIGEVWELEPAAVVFDEVRVGFLLVIGMAAVVQDAGEIRGEGLAVRLVGEAEEDKGGAAGFVVGAAIEEFDRSGAGAGLHFTDGIEGGGPHGLRSKENVVEENGVVPLAAGGALDGDAETGIGPIIAREIDEGGGKGGDVLLAAFAEAPGLDVLELEGRSGGGEQRQDGGAHAKSSRPR